jgi:hypothetical protein
MANRVNPLGFNMLFEPLLTPLNLVSFLIALP